MPRHKLGPRMYKRPGRLVWYASLSDEEKHISLGTEDEDEAHVEFAKLLERRRVRRMAPNEVALVKLFEITRERADAVNTPKTAYEIHLNLRRILQWCESRGIYSARQISHDTIEDYKTSRKFSPEPRGRGSKARTAPIKYVSAARINRELDTWRRAMTVAIKKKCAPADAVTWFDKLREPRPKPHQRGLTKRELDLFLKNVGDADYKALFRGALGSGLRDDELRHLAKTDIRGDKVTVTPKTDWTTKSYRHREIRVTPATAAALRRYIKARAKSKTKFGQRAVWQVMQDACSSAKLKPFSMHDLRRAWASHLFEGGVSLKVVSQMLGHAEVATTERYLRVVTDELPKAKSLPW